MPSPPDRDDLSRERRPPANRDDRPEPPPTAERFFPRSARRPAADHHELADEPTSELHPGADAWPAPRQPAAARRPSDPSRSAVAPRAAAAGTEGAGPGPTLDGADSEAQGTAEGVSGPELARAVIDAALTKRRDTARSPRRPVEGTGRRPRGYSGSGPDPRDPQLFGDMLQRLMKARGWERPRAEATVFGAWEKVVGPDIAEHSRPIKLDAGVLTVEAESTAWATQLRLMTGQLLRSIAAEVGHNVVARLNIHGPAVPTWTKGPRRVQGRGPRDTYG